VKISHHILHSRPASITHNIINKSVASETIIISIMMPAASLQQRLDASDGEIAAQY